MWVMVSWWVDPASGLDAQVDHDMHDALVGWTNRRIAPHVAVVAARTASQIDAVCVNCLHVEQLHDAAVSVVVSAQGDGNPLWVADPLDAATRQAIAQITRGSVHDAP